MLSSEQRRSIDKALEEGDALDARGLVRDDDDLRDLCDYLAESRLSASVRSLDLENTPITDDQLHYLKGLTVLTVLNLGGTPITRLDAIRGLNKLTTLGLGGTQITDDQLHHLKRLTELTNLNLWSTPITRLEAIRGLKKLTTLDLRDTNVKGLKPLKGLEKLTTLWIDHKGFDIERSTGSNARVILGAYFGDTRLDLARLVVVGEGWNGKSSLCDWGFLNLPLTGKGSRSTHDIRILRPDDLPWRPVVKGRELGLHLWDFGGQDVLHGVHELFLGPGRSPDGRTRLHRTAYLLVLDATKEAEGVLVPESRKGEGGNRLTYWCRLLEHFAGANDQHPLELPVAVAVTKYDEPDHLHRLHEPGGEWSFPQELRDGLAEHKLRLFGPVCGLSARERNANGDEFPIDGFRELISDTFGSMELSGKVPPEYPEVQRRVLEGFPRSGPRGEGDRPPFVHLDTYYGWCDKVGVGRTAANGLLRMLHNLGVAYYFGLTDQEEAVPESERHGTGLSRGEQAQMKRRKEAQSFAPLRDHLINPEWLNYPIYELMVRSAAAQHGHLMHTSKVDDCIRDADKANRFTHKPQGLEIVKSVLNVYGLSHQDGDNWFFPRGLPLEGHPPDWASPGTDAWPSADHVTLCWRFVPEAAFNRLMVDWRSNGWTLTGCLWRYGMVVERDGARACVQLLPDHCTIRIDLAKGEESARCGLLAALKEGLRREVGGKPEEESCEPSKHALSADKRATDLSAVQDDTWYNEDYTYVRWYGRKFVFHPRQQAEVVRALWENGGPLHNSSIADKVVREGKKNRNWDLAKVFRKNGILHPAIGPMIYKVKKATWALKHPDVE